MSRIQKLETIYKEQLKNHNINDVSDFIQSILDADITKGKYARFLIEAFLNDKFLEEDLMGGLDSTIGQAITLFDKHKGKLPLKQRSVFALDEETGEALYQSPGDLWNNVKQFQGELSGKELKKEEQEKIYRETEFVYKDEETGFQIISPLTKESAQWWGKGTRWCTSAENNNMFWNYASKAPLLILLMPASAGTAGNGDKLQLWKNGDDIQFMDEADKTVTLEYIEKHWNILEPICMWLNDIRFIPINFLNYDLYFNFLEEKIIQPGIIPFNIQDYELAKKMVINGSNLIYIRDELITKELCELAVKNNGFSLYHVPNRLKTPELCKLAVRQKAWTLLDVPKKFITPELCKLAVQNYGLALQYVPEELRTPELCEMAVKQDETALKYIPEEYITKELCKMIIGKNPYVLKDIPKKYKTEELYKLAVQQDAEIFHDIPKESITKEICEMAVKQDGIILEAIPREFIDNKIKLMAIESNNNAIMFLSKTDITYDLCKILFQEGSKSNKELLKYIPEELRTRELCELAIKQNGYNIQYVPEHLNTKELCEKSFDHDVYSIEVMPKEYITKKMYSQAVKKDGKLIRYVPEKLRTKKMIIDAIKNYVSVMKILDEYKFDREIYLEIIKQDSYLIGIVPYEIIDEEFCHIIANEKPFLLKYIPEKLKTEDVYQMIYKNNSKNIQYIPDNIVERLLKQDEKGYIERHKKNNLVYEEIRSKFSHAPSYIL